MSDSQSAINSDARNPHKHERHRRHFANSVEFFSGRRSATAHNLAMSLSEAIRRRGVFAGYDDALRDIGSHCLAFVQKGKNAVKRSANDTSTLVFPVLLLEPIDAKRSSSVVGKEWQTIMIIFERFLEWLLSSLAIALFIVAIASVIVPLGLALLALCQERSWQAIEFLIIVSITAGFWYEVGYFLTFSCQEEED